MISRLEAGPKWRKGQKDGLRSGVRDWISATAGVTEITRMGQCKMAHACVAQGP